MFRKLSAGLLLAGLLLLGLTSTASAQTSSPVISFAVPNGTIIRSSQVSAYGIPGLAYVSFRVDSAIPLLRVSVTGFYESLSTYLGGNSGWATGGLYVYTPFYMPGPYPMTVDAVDVQGHESVRTLTVNLMR